MKFLRVVLHVKQFPLRAVVVLVECLEPVGWLSAFCSVQDVLDIREEGKFQLHSIYYLYHTLVERHVKQNQTFVPKMAGKIKFVIG